MMTLRSPTPLADKWRWSISDNLYRDSSGGTGRVQPPPEYAAYIWDESQGVEPWLPAQDGRGSFWLLDQSERKKRQSFLRSPYYGLFRYGTVWRQHGSIRCLLSEKLALRFLPLSQSAAAGVAVLQ